MSYRIAHIEDIHVTATEAEALSDDNKLEGGTEVDFSIEHTMAELMELNTDGYSKNERTWSAVSGSLTCNAIKGSATQGVLDAAAEGGTVVYLTVITDPAATVGNPKGIRYPLKISSVGSPRTAGELITTNYQAVGHGKPAIILA